MELDWTAPVSHPPFWRMHLRRCIAYPPIEIELEHAPFVVLFYFFPHLNMQKNLLIMGPKNLSLKCDFLIFNLE
jgi:hypothetical protein